MKYVLFLLAVVGSSGFAIERVSLLQNYFPIQKALSADDVPGAQVKAASLKAAAQTVLKASKGSDPQRGNVEQIVVGSEKMARAANAAAAREAFGTLSKGLIEMVRQDASLRTAQQLFYCGMTKPYGGWVQPAGEKIANPYWGSKMLRCGSKKPW